MSGTLMAAIFGAGGVGAILAAMITGLFSKKKLGAEATEIITKAAAGVVTNLQSEIDRQVELREELTVRYRGMIDELMASHEVEMDDVRRVLQLHVSWDAIAIAKMAELDIELPPAPPLLPPRHHGRLKTEVDWKGHRPTRSPQEES